MPFTFHNPRLKSMLIIAGTLLFGLTVLGQTNERVTIIGTFQPSLGEFQRIGITPAPVEATFKPGALNYTFLDNLVPTQTELESIAPLQVLPEQRGRFYNNFIQAAFGSRISPYLHYAHSSPIANNTRFGLGIRHFSSWLDMDEYAPSDFMQNRFDLGLDNDFRNHSLSVNLFYTYNTNRYYGFKPDIMPGLQFEKADLLIARSTIGGKLNFGSNYSNPLAFNHRLGLDYYYLYDNQGSAEHGASAVAALQKGYQWLNIDSKQALALEATYEMHMNADSIGSSTAMNMGLQPAIVFDGKYYYLKAGLQLNLERQDSSRLHLYPALSGKLFLFESAIELYSNLGGGLKRLTYRRAAEENPFVGVILPYRWENTRLEYSGGLKAGFIRNLEFHFGVQYSEIADKAFFINFNQNQLNNSFTYVFDDVQVFRFKAEAAYRFRERFGLYVSYQLQEFTMTQLTFPLHEEKHRLTTKIEINPTEKLGFTLEAIAVDERPAMIFNMLAVEQFVMLDPYVDLNLGSVYRFNERFTASFRVNNLLNKHYEAFLNYPVHGIQFFAGVSYSF